MIFPHNVKHNGILYKPGQDVPIEIKQDDALEPVVDTKDQVQDNDLKPVKGDGVLEKTPQLTEREEELMNLKKDELLQLASNLGLDVNKGDNKAVLVEQIINFEQNGMNEVNTVDVVDDSDLSVGTVAEHQGSLLDDIINTEE